MTTTDPNASAPASAAVGLLAGLVPLSAACSELDITTRTAARWEAIGLLRCVRIGRSVYVDVEATRALLRGESPRRRLRARVA